MKKVLSFVLVLAMVLGSVSMAFAAAEYKDQASITNEEAVAVLSELKVLEGDANGFRPTDTLTRAEAAAILARLVLGRDEADKLAKAATQFSDVPATHWAAGYINYCVSEGIIAGNGDGTFNPDGLLTVSAFTKMALCALGYKAEIEGLVGPNWEAATASLAVKAGLTVDATGNCTRETAALIGLKTLEADVVAYDQAAVTVNAGGAQVVVGGSSAKPITVKDSSVGGTAPEYNGVADGVQQLAEKVYKKDLKKQANTPDEFGRVAKKWTYKGETVGTYGDVTDADKVLTAKTTESTLSKSYKNANDFDATGAAVTVNGTPQASIAAIADLAALTHNGRTVEIYKENGKITNVVAYDKFLAEVTKVNDSAEKNTYKVKAGVGFGTSPEFTLNDEYGYGNFSKGDYVIITYSQTAAAGKQIKSAELATKITGAVNSVETETLVAPAGTFAKTITIDGTKYTTAYGSVQASASDKTYDAYIDSESLVYYVPASSASKSYAVLVSNAGATTDELGKAVYKAQLVFADGTTSVVTLKDDSASAAGIYEYTVSSGKYTLTAPALNSYAHFANIAMNTKLPSITGTQHFFTDTTDFYMVKDAGSTSMKVTAYSGAQKITTTAAVDVYYITNKEAAAASNASITTAIVVTNAKASNSTKDIVYAKGGVSANTTMIGTDKYYTHEIYINGEKNIVPSEANNVAAGFYQPTTDNDGVYDFGTPEATGVEYLVNTTIAGAYAGNLTLNETLDTKTVVKVSDDVIVIDLRSSLWDEDKMTSVDDVVNYKSDYPAQVLKASLVYNDKDDVVTYIFVTSGAPQHTL